MHILELVIIGVGYGGGGGGGGAGADSVVHVVRCGLFLKLCTTELADEHS